MSAVGAARLVSAITARVLTGCGVLPAPAAVSERRLALVTDAVAAVPAGCLHRPPSTCTHAALQEGRNPSVSPRLALTCRSCWAFVRRDESGAVAVIGCGCMACWAASTTEAGHAAPSLIVPAGLVVVGLLAATALGGHLLVGGLALVGVGATAGLAAGWSLRGAACDLAAALDDDPLAELDESGDWFASLPATSDQADPDGQVWS